MKRKTYHTPTITEAETLDETLICASVGDLVNSDNGIGYGGVDEEGELDPASRRRGSCWDEEEEE